MSTITFDTLKYVERLKSAGVPEARARAEALRDVLAQVSYKITATKHDLVSGVTPVKAEIAKLDKELAVVKWMVGLVVAGIATLIVKAFTA